MSDRQRDADVLRSLDMRVIALEIDSEHTRVALERIEDAQSDAQNALTERTIIESQWQRDISSKLARNTELTQIVADVLLAGRWMSRITTWLFRSIKGLALLIAAIAGAAIAVKDVAVNDHITVAEWVVKWWRK